MNIDGQVARTSALLECFVTDRLQYHTNSGRTRHPDTGVRSGIHGLKNDLAAKRHVGNLRTKTVTEPRVVAVIPARGGSKGLPRKNIKILAGRPLIEYSIVAAQEAPSIDRVVVSTDSNDIAKISAACGAQVRSRPDHLATDGALVSDVLRDLHLRMSAEGDAADYFVLLQPTSPLRQVADIEACIRLVTSGAFDTAASFTPAATHPNRVFSIDEGGARSYVSGNSLWAPRQALNPVYELNGAVYVFSTAGLMESGPGVLFGRIGAVIMPRSRSVDIDDDYDFRMAEALLRREDSE